MKTPAKILAGALLVALVATNAATWHVLRTTRSELGSAQVEGAATAAKLATSEEELITARAKIGELTKDLNEGLDSLKAEINRLAGESQAMQRPFARDEFLGTVTTITGRSIEDAMLMQLTAANITLRTTDSIASIPIRELQPELRLRAAASLFDRSWSTAPGMMIHSIPRAENSRSAAPQAAAYQPPPARPPTYIPAVAQAPAGPDASAIKQAAAAYAERHFEKNQVGGSNAWSFAANSAIEEPVEMSGWDNQWRVAGEVMTRTLTAQGGITSPNHRFEAIVALKSGVYKVIDFTVR